MEWWGRRKIKDARTMWKETREREFGNIRPNLFSSRISKSRVSSIQLSNYKEIVSAHRGAVNSLQVATLNFNIFVSTLNIVILRLFSLVLVVLCCRACVIFPIYPVCSLVAIYFLDLILMACTVLINILFQIGSSFGS